MKILQGSCRKASLPVVGVAALGWLVFVVGFAAFNNGDNYYNDIRKDHSFKDEEGRTISLGYSNETIEENFPAQRADADYFPFWCFVISFPVLMVFLVLHLILHDLYIFGVIGHLLLGLCFLCGSGVFWSDGRFLFSKDDNFREQFEGLGIPKDWRSDTYYGVWRVVEWVGVFVCLLALIAYGVLVPFYTTSCKRGGNNSEQGEEMGEK